MQVCWKWQHATDVVKRIQDLFNLEIALKYLNHAELFSVCQICGSCYWSGVWLSTLFFPDIHWHNIRYDIFIIMGTWGPGQLKHLISKVNLNASLRPNITALKKNTSRWIFHLTHQKTWWQKNVHSVQCSGAFLYLGKLLFIVSTSPIIFVKGISIQKGEIQPYWSLWYFISAA